jgi:GTP pyrophosphokinase
MGQEKGFAASTERVQGTKGDPLDPDMDRTLFFALIPAMMQVARQLIFWAYDIAKRWHDDQARDSGERYFEHVRGVAKLLIEYGYTDPLYLALALLHDILEDTWFPITMLEQLFGPEFARDVISLSKSICIEHPVTGRMIRTPKLSTEEYEQQLAHATKRAIIVKCCDRIHNDMTLIRLHLNNPSMESRWTPEKCLRYAQETLDFVVPLAERHDPRLAQRLRHEVELIRLNVKAWQVSMSTAG